ncbi:Methyl-CpG-binding domain-containing protein [Drosera capensis]
MAEESTDWPPPEWRTKVEAKNGRKIKYYVNKRSGLKCYSKPALLRVLEAENSKIKAFQSPSEHSKSTSSRLDNRDEPRWLPSGWRLEWKVRKSGRAMGSKYRCYVERSTGMKFYSEPEVSRYLMEKQKNIISAEPNEEDISYHSSSKVVIETTIDEELPPGWLKEIRIKKLGGKLGKDTYYVNPMVNYIFNSEEEVLRYLDTGRLTKNARTRKNDGINEEINGCKITVPSSKKTRMTTADAVNKSLLEEPEDLENGQSKPSDLLGDERGSLDSVIEEVTVGTKPISKTKSRKHKQDKKALNVPNRPSGHLAGVEAQPVFSTLPIEHTIRANRRGSQKAKSVPSTDLVPNDSTAEKPEKEDKKATNVPSRTSRRLAGVKAQPKVSSLPIEHTIRATCRASQMAKSVSSTIPVPNDPTAEQPDIDIPKKPAAPDSSALRLPSDTVPRETTGKRVRTHKNVGDKKSEPVSPLVELVEDPPVAAQTPARIDTNGNDKGPFCCTAIWSDPCLECAYKTLTGAIPLDPLDDNLTIQDYVDHQLRTSNQTNGDVNASNMTKPNSPSNGMASHYDSGKPPAPPLSGYGHLPYAFGFAPQSQSKGKKGRLR